jgi:hypothetical protein
VGSPDPDFFVSRTPKGRWFCRVVLTVAIAFLLTAVAGCFAVAMMVVAFVNALASIGTELAGIFGFGIVATLCLTPFIIELISLLSTGQIVPFVVRLISLLNPS